MLIITIQEIIYILITVIVTGYIFSGIFRREYSEIEHKTNQNLIFNSYKIFNWEDVKLGMMIAAPGIVLHEMAHKFTALAFGLIAIYHIYPTGLVIGIVLRALNSGFIFLAPGYVTIYGGTEIQSMLTAFAGPLTNLLLWVIPLLILKYYNKISPRTTFILTATKQVNMWLFIFNMIPIPPLDGSKVILPLLGLL